MAQDVSRVQDLRWRRARMFLLVLMGLAAFFHLVQLPLYPINPKWVAALVGACVYTASTYGIYKNHPAGYVLALCPILAAFFVAGIVILGPPPGAPEFRFNFFTAMAAIVEVPAVPLSLFLLKQGIWKHR